VRAGLGQFGEGLVPLGVGGHGDLDVHAAACGGCQGGGDGGVVHLLVFDGQGAGGPVLAAYLFAHRTMINGSPLCAAWFSPSVTTLLP
jgi:hypothetical protein